MWDCHACCLPGDGHWFVPLHLHVNQNPDGAAPILEYKQRIILIYLPYLLEQTNFNRSVQSMWDCWNELRGYVFQKLLLAWNFSCISKKCFFIKETDTFGHIVVWTIYTSHIDHFTSQHTAFEQSAACLSVFLDLLHGLIPFAILWHAGWTLGKTVAWTWTTIIRLQYM